MVNRSFGFVVALVANLFIACASTHDDTEFATDAQSAFELFTSEGMSCRCMEALQALPTSEAEIFRSLVWESVAPEDVVRLIENRDIGCGTEDSEDVSSVAVSTGEITGTYTVEPIEYQSSTGGYQPVSIFVDSSSTCMCGSDCGTWQADYVAEFDNVSGALLQHEQSTYLWYERFQLVLSW